MKNIFLCCEYITINRNTTTMCVPIGKDALLQHILEVLWYSQYSVFVNGFFFFVFILSLEIMDQT